MTHMNKNINILLLRIPISKVFLIFLVFEELHKDFVSFANVAQIVKGSWLRPKRLTVKFDLNLCLFPSSLGNIDTLLI